MYSKLYLLRKMFAFNFRESQDILSELVNNEDFLHAADKINLFEHLETVSNVDHLTQTKTYLSFLEDIYGDIEYLENNRDKNITYFGFNISGFAPLNDYCYHHLGDQVLTAISKIISKYNEESEILVRFNGVNFLFGIKNTSQQEALAIAKKIQEDFSKEVIKLPLDLGQVMNEQYRAELKDHLTDPESNSRFIKAVSVLLDIGGKEKVIAHEIYETDIRQLPMRSKKENNNFVRGFLLNLGFVQIPGGRNIGRQEITASINKLIERLNANSGKIESLSYTDARGSLETDLHIANLIKKVQKSRSVKAYDLNRSVPRENRYAAEDLINYDNFLHKTKKLLQSYYSSDQEARDKIEIIPSRNGFSEIMDFHNYQSDKIHWAPSNKYILMPLFNFKGSPISVLKLRVNKADFNQDPEEQGKFLNTVKYIEKAFRAVDRLAGYDALTKLPTGLKFINDLNQRLGCPVGAVDLDQFGAYSHMFGFKAGDRVKQGVARVMKQMEEHHSYREYKLRFYLTGGEEFKVIGNCTAEQMAEILDELSWRLQISLEVRVPLSWEQIAANIEANYQKEVSKETYKEILEKTKEHYEKLVDKNTGYVDVVKLPRYHKKYRRWYTGQTSSGGVVDTSNIELLKNKATELNLTIENYIATLANYAEEHSKEGDKKETTVVRLKG